MKEKAMQTDTLLTDRSDFGGAHRCLGRILILVLTGNWFNSLSLYSCLGKVIAKEAYSQISYRRRLQRLGLASLIVPCNLNISLNLYSYLGV